MAHVDLTVAEHEAAHMVVGLALGLRFKRAVVGAETWRAWIISGYTWFAVGPRLSLATGITACAGIAWENRPNGDPAGAIGDHKVARQYLLSLHDVRTGTRVATEMLASRRRIHTKIAHELCEGSLGPRDVARLVLGD